MIHPYLTAWTLIFVTNWRNCPDIETRFIPYPQRTAFGWKDKVGLTKYTGLTETK
jgi:hypothetical protein